MVTYCEIKFNKPENLYYAGETLSGIVNFDLHEKIKIRKLYLKIEGVGEVKWNHSHPGSTPVKTNIMYVGKEKYLNVITDLEGEGEIIAGSHTYYFSCNLPQNVPSSTKVSKGSIKYSANLIFDRPWKFDIKHSFEFKVIQHVDLNSDPLLKVPNQQELIKTFCCFIFCESKPVVITASLPFTGFIPGQTCQVPVDVMNPTDTEIQNVQISLIKYITYRSTCPKDRMKMEEHNQHQVITGPSCVNDVRSYSINFTIPDTVPSSKYNIARVLNISYEIHVKLKVSNCHRSPVIKFPVTIGTIPFAGSEFYGFYPTSSAPPYSESLYPSAPPSFEEAIKMSNSANLNQNRTSIDRPIGFLVS